MLVEFKIRPVTRYIVTKNETSGPDPDGKGVGSSSTIGEYDNANMAYEVAYAVCKEEHRRLGFPPGDERIQYPKEVNESVNISNITNIVNEANLDKLNEFMRKELPKIIRELTRNGRL